MRSSVLVISLAASLYAGGLDDAFGDAKYDGYLRAGYQNQDEGEFSVGGKLHLETAPINSISFGTSFYTTQSIGDKYNDGIPFFSSDLHSYSILGEAYLQSQFENTTIKIGRQEIDTPYADTDDIGMIPNTFEAITVVNTDLTDTIIIASYLKKMAGVDADIPEKFSRINGSDGVQTIGVSNSSIENVELQGWFYNVPDLVKLTYLEAGFQKSLDKYNLGLVGQYTIQDYDNGDNVDVYGVSVSVGIEDYGVEFFTAYNKADSTNGKVADNFFGGGPFFINCEHITMADIGADESAYRIGTEIDASLYGLQGFGMNLSYFEGGDLEEIDIVASYFANEQLSFDLIYTDTTNNADDSASFKNTRFFANYSF